MTLLAQALKRAKLEFIDVATVWLDVIAVFRRLDDAALRAVRTELVPLSTGHLPWI